MAISFSSGLIVVVHLLLCLTVAGQETVVLHNNYKTHHYYSSSSSSSSSIAATVAGSDLFNLSSSVILAETWLRNHVLSHYPSTNITSIVVGEDLDLSCNITTLPPQILPSVKNLHYSLVRWGLVRDIKASIAFSHDCFKTHYHHHHQQQHTYLSPVLSFLQDSNSIYTINPPLHFDHSPASIFRLISTHKRGLDRLGFYRLKIVILGDPLNVVHRTRVRKLISYPEKPKSSDFQNHAPSSPESIFSFIPSASPSEIPQDFVSPSPSSSLSPCPAFDHHYHHRDMTTLSPTKARDDDGLWCVAKPAVPTETLQKGIDFACGKGGADCEEISPKGSCYYPDNVVAHASYAYNSYWQKTRSNGGSCGFDGTAILIDVDPSFLHCRFQIGN